MRIHIQKKKERYKRKKKKERKTNLWGVDGWGRRGTKPSFRNCSEQSKIVQLPYVAGRLVLNKRILPKKTQLLTVRYHSPMTSYK